MVSVLRLTLTRVAWLYQTLVGAFFQIVICLQNLENVLAPDFTIRCAHTLSPIQMAYTSHSLPLVLYLWQESAKSNLAFSFDFTSYQQPNITQVGFLSKGQWPLHAGLLRQTSMLVQYRVHGLDQSVIFRLVSYTLYVSREIGELRMYHSNKGRHTRVMNCTCVYCLHLRHYLQWAHKRHETGGAVLAAINCLVKKLQLCFVLLMYAKLCACVLRSSCLPVCLSVCLSVCVNLHRLPLLLQVQAEPSPTT